MKSLTWIALTLALAVGCKPSSPKFMEQIVVVDCDYRVSCFDDAVLEFHNWNDAATCQRDATTDWSDRIAGCTYDKKLAKTCLKELEAVVESGTCPAENPSYPDSCLLVGTACTDSSDTGDDGSDSGADAGTDSGTAE